jgi:hypothetical protein
LINPRWNGAWAASARIDHELSQPREVAGGERMERPKPGVLRPIDPLAAGHDRARKLDGRPDTGTHDRERLAPTVGPAQVNADQIVGLTREGTANKPRLKFPDEFGGRSQARADLRRGREDVTECVRDVGHTQRHIGSRQPAEPDVGPALGDRLEGKHHRRRP